MVSAPEYPPIAEVEALWTSCGPLRRDDAVARWLASEGRSARDLDARDAARALPVGAACPSWARASSRRVWSRSPYRVLFPLYDAQGVMRSLLARYVGRVHDSRPQRRALLATRAAYTYERRGLVLADADGVGILRGEVSAPVAIVDGDEGLCRSRDLREATIAVLSGSWSEDLARRVANGATSLVIASTDWRVTSSLDALGVEYDLEDDLARRQRERLDEERRHVGALLDAPVRAVAKVLGRTALGYACGHLGEPVCPACDLMTEVSPNGLRWACTGRPYGYTATHGACGARGDALDFAAVDMTRLTFAELVALAHGWGRPGPSCATPAAAISFLPRLAKRAKAIARAIRPARSRVAA